MLDLQQQPFAKYILFTSLYFTEGIQLSITTVLIPIYLLETGFSPAITTMIAALAMLPWALKFIFGYIINTIQSINLKTFTILGGIISSISLLLLSIITPNTILFLFILLIIIAQCGIGFLDVSTDAWAIDTTKKKEHGKINGFMMAGLFSGIAIGAPLLSFIAEHNEYTISFLTAGTLNLSILFIAFLTKKPSYFNRKNQVLKILKKEFKQKKTQAIALLLPILSINSGIITLAVPLFMSIQLELSISQIGLITTVFTVSRVIGSITCGTLSDKIGRQKTLLLIVSLSIIATVLLLLVNTWSILLPIYGLLGFLNGGLFSVLLATSMDITNFKISAIQFSLLISFMNSGELIGEFISGPLLTIAGFSKLFLFAAWILGPSLLFLYISKSRKLIPN